MRPRKLTLRNFMPFRSPDGQVQEVDFSNLDLFAITGPMGSGKSSLTDAIVWCLYGRTARYGADSKGVLSVGESACEVALDFTIGPRWFRAVRRTGKTTESGLSEQESGEWIEDTSGAEQLTKRIEELLGLDFDSFTKTVILPQGQYAEFLMSEPKKRRDLLANILALGVYSRVGERAKEVAGHAKTRAETLREMLTQYANVSRELIEQRCEERIALEQQIEESGRQETILRGLVKQAEVADAAFSRVTELQTEECMRREEKDQARLQQDEVEMRVLALAQQVAQNVGERDALGYDAHRHEIVKRAATHLRTYQVAYQEAGQKNQALALVRQELDALARQITDQEQHVTVARRLSQERAAALQEEIAASGDSTVLTEKLGQAKRWKDLQQEQKRLVQQQEADTQQLTHVCESLAALLQQEEANDQELRELLQLRDQRREEEQEKKRLELEAEHLGKELQEAVRQEKHAAQEVENAQSTLQRAEQEEQKQHKTVVTAEQREQVAVRTLEESRQRHEAAHLRLTLHIGDPCPVCHTRVEELPSLEVERDTEREEGGGLSQLSVLQQAIEAARTALADTRQLWQQAHAALAAARTRKEAATQALTEREQRRRQAQEQFIARFPGFPSLAAALSALQTQRQELSTALSTLEIKTQTAEKEKHALSLQCQKAQQEEARLTEALRSVSKRIESAKEELTILAQSLASYLSTDRDPEAVLMAHRQSLMQREQEVKASEQKSRQAEEALRSLKTDKIKKEGEFDVLTVQAEAATARADREAQATRENLALAVGSPLPALSMVEDELTALEQKREQHSTLSQKEETLRREREQVEQQAAGLRADLQARERDLDRTRQKLSQAEKDLEHARAALQTEMAQRGLADINPDGEGLKERLSAVQGQVMNLRERRSRLEAEVIDLERRCVEKEQEEEKLRTAETDGRLATDLYKLLGAEFTDFLSQGAVEALMRDAGIHLQRLTHGRYSFDIAYKRRAIELQIVDHEDHRRTRPTHSLSGGETFLASLAIALALSQGFREVATGKAAKTSTECLILDEGFGTLDREGLQLVTETLQELRGEEGRMVGIVTHVEEVAAAMPMRIEVHKGNRTSTVTVSG